MEIDEFFEFDTGSMKCPNCGEPMGYYLDRLVGKDETKCEECGAVYSVQMEYIFFGRMIRIEEPEDMVIIEVKE